MRYDRRCNHGSPPLSGCVAVALLAGFISENHLKGLARQLALHAARTFPSHVSPAAARKALVGTTPDEPPFRWEQLPPHSVIDIWCLEGGTTKGLTDSRLPFQIHRMWSVRFGLRIPEIERPLRWEEHAPKERCSTAPLRSTPRTVRPSGDST